MESQSQSHRKTIVGIFNDLILKMRMQSRQPIYFPQFKGKYYWQLNDDDKRELLEIYNRKLTANDTK